jgi:hypothetical protein
MEYFKRMEHSRQKTGKVRTYRIGNRKNKGIKIRKELRTKVRTK